MGGVIKMKITKRKIRRIIKEERAKLLLEMDPMADANRSLGGFANISSVDALTDSILNILQEVEMGVGEEEGLEPDEAEEKARNAAILAVSQAFESAGIMDVKFALQKLLR